MSAPVFAHGQLRLYLLTLLNVQPMHGYELMQAIESRFAGTYVPSAGTIYPRLAKLADEGLITKASVGRKTVYAITKAGRAELSSRKGETDRLERDIDTSARALADELRADISSSMGSLKDDLEDAVDQASRFRAQRRYDERAGHASKGRNRGTGRRSAADETAVPTGNETAGSSEAQHVEQALHRFESAIGDALHTADSHGKLSADRVRGVLGELEIAASRIKALINGQ